MRWGKTLSALFLLLPTVLAAQQSQVQPFLPKIMGQSPEANGIARSGNYEVNMYSGLPNISIPLYEIKAGEITVPISINYHASGIRVTDAGSWVGLGWNLTAGGSITRKTMGMPDELVGNYLRAATVKTTSQIDPNTSTGLNYLHDVYRQRLDVDPDIFSYQLTNKSGKFFFNQQDNYKPIIIPYDPLIINKTFVTGGMNMDIIDDGGMLYRFDVLENTTSVSSASSTATSAWKVSKIISSNKKDTVEFSYTSRYGQISDDPIDYIAVTDQHGTSTCAPSPEPYTGAVASTYNSTMTIFCDEKNLSQILFPNGKITFETGATNRTDISGSKWLQFMRIYHWNPVYNDYVLLKSYRFYASYFSSAQCASVGKLKLDSLAQFDASGNLVETHRFDYNVFNLPTTNKRARDYWGYYNGVNNNILVPRMTIQIENATGGVASQLTIGSTQVNSRDPNPTYMQMCMLKKIYFPTGGYTDFEFETNQYYDANAALVKYAGGLRIKTIKSYDGINATPILKTYKYGDAEVGYGKPNFILNNYFFTATQRNQFVDYVGNNGPNVCDHQRVRTYLSNSSIDLEPYDGVPVAYPTVTEYMGDDTGPLGRTIFKFSYRTDGLSASMVTGKPIVTSYHFDRGLLEEKGVYKRIAASQFQLMQKTNNTYVAFPEQFVQNVGLVANKILITDNSTSTTDVDLPAGTAGLGPFDSQNYVFSNYSIRTGDNRLVRTTDTFYHQDIPARYLATAIDYLYENALHKQVTKTITTNSLGETISTIKKYPHEMSATLPYSTMIGTGVNILNKVVEEHRLVNSVQTNLVRTNYTNSSGSYVPASIQTQLKTSPIETRALFSLYDTEGNLLQMAKLDDVVQSFIWDYNKKYPIAQITNASQNQVAYTSFEADGSGNWTISAGARVTSQSITGQKSYNLAQGNITKSSVPTEREYYVSYWSRSGSANVNGVAAVPGLAKNGWTYYEHKLPSTTNSITISGGMIIDELRLFPKGSSMNTTTYDPLVGITTECDQFNTITYYEYDDAQRLQVIRDIDRNVLKRVDYQYLVSTSDNTYASTARSQSFTRQCPCGETGSSVSYPLPQGAHLSTVNLTDANLRRDNHIAAKGQLYANKMGTCTPIPCSGNQYKIVNCTTCELGTKVFVSSFQVNATTWVCTYRYYWSDGTFSSNFNETSGTPCVQ